MVQGPGYIPIRDGGLRMHQKFQTRHGINSIFVDDIGISADEIEAYCFLEPGTLKEKTPKNVIKLRDSIVKGCI